MSKEELSTGKQRSCGLSVLRVVGGAAAVLVAVAVISSLHDIRRYWRMVRM